MLANAYLELGEEGADPNMVRDPLANLVARLAERGERQVQAHDDQGLAVGLWPPPRDRLVLSRSLWDERFESYFLD